MFSQEAGSDHPDPVVHETRGIELAHACIHYRVPGHAVAPSGELLLIVTPEYGVILRSEGFIRDMREVPQDAHKKLSPYQLVEPRLIEVQSGPDQASDADRSEA